jgi:large subunit ribosomal protein L14e
MVNYGPYEGKLATIIDVIDQNRALVSGPTTGVPRQAINFKRLALTDFKLTLPRGANVKVLSKALESHQVVEKWEQTDYAKKRAARTKRPILMILRDSKLCLSRKRPTVLFVKLPKN